MDRSPVYSCLERTVVGFPLPHDEVWNDLPAMQLREAKTGNDAKLATTVSSFWNETSLYFRFVCEDNRIIATMSDRDDPIYEEDVVEVFISETGEMSNYKEFELSPTNVQFDALIHNDLEGKIKVDTEWDAPGWQTSVYIGPDKAQVIYVWQIPFVHFTGGTPSKGDQWLMNCYRIDRGGKEQDEYSAWSPPGKLNFHIPQKFGVITFL